MRTSTKRTTSAILRTILEIKDFEMAELLGCARTTIHDLEAGRKKLSESMAMRMHDETFISLEWLLAGDVSAPPISQRGEPYTRAIFEEAQAIKPLFSKASRAWQLNHNLILAASLAAVLSSASERGKYATALYKAEKAIEDLRNEFGHDPAIYEPTNSDSIRPDQVLVFLERLQGAADSIRAGIRDFDEIAGTFSKMGIPFPSCSPDKSTFSEPKPKPVKKRTPLNERRLG